MTAVRQDAWTKDEDLLLAEVVLRHIREGSTQLKAFEEVGKKLNRTPAACGFRWNSYVRKQYKEGIELAKKQRKELKKKERETAGLKDREVVMAGRTDVQQGKSRLTMEDVISFLQEYQEKEKKKLASGDELEIYKERCRSLEKKVQTLTEENERLKKEMNILKEDYKTFLSLMEKARKLTMEEGNQENSAETDSEEPA